MLESPNFVTFIDTHCHLNILIKGFDTRALSQEDLEQAHALLTEAKMKHVSHIINVGNNFSDSLECIALAHAFDNVYATLGIHPGDVTATWREDLEKFEEYLARDARVVGVGECGLDYHYEKYDPALQRELFIAQIQLARRYNKALVVHTRDAGNDTIDILEEHAQGLRGIVHCFSEDVSFAQRTRKLGFFLGIGGTVTYPKNEMLRVVVRDIGIEGIVLETDTPFLPPQPLRGTKNSPANIPLIGAYVAELLKIDTETVAQITTQNATIVFGGILSTEKI